MSATLSPQTLATLSEFLALRIGLNFPPKRWNDLERGIAAVAPELGFSDVQSCAYSLLSNPLTRPIIEALAKHLTVGETYFFREPRGFEVLEDRILPALLHGAQRRLRIWSAGCCTGEEPYSIAMLLDRLIPDQKAWDITILATDINPRFLQKAVQGVYSEWSFRGTPAWLRQRYFKKRRDGRFEILPQLKSRVTFSYFNLADDTHPALVNNNSAMDVIFCRNVLMYFALDRVPAVAQHFYQALIDGGWLIVSPAETSNALFSPFTAVEFPGVVLYRKIAPVAQRAVVVQYPPPPLVAPQAVPQAAPIFGPHAQSDDCTVFSRNARASANQGKLDAAFAWCEKAIAIDKLNPAHYYLFAAIRQEQGQVLEAAQALQQALYLDPDFVLAHFTLGNLRLAQGQPREARRHFDNASALLHQYPREAALPESEGMTAGRLAEIVASAMENLPQPIGVGV